VCTSSESAGIKNRPFVKVVIDLFFSVEFLAPFIFLPFFSNVEGEREKVSGARS